MATSDDQIAEMAANLGLPEDLVRQRMDDLDNELREISVARKRELKLEAELADAKEAYRDNRDDDKAKARLDKAKRAIVEARRARREAAGVTGVTVGGDAVIS